jgi:signal transduction histidine kinase
MARRFLDAYGELVLVVALGLAAQAELWLDPTWEEDRLALAPVALGMSVVLLLRQSAPLVTLAVEIVGLSMISAINAVEGNDPMTVVLVALVAVYSAGAHAGGRRLLGAVTLVALAIGAAVVADGSSYNVSGVIFFGVVIGGPFLAGVVIRIRRERERLLVQERDERARAAVAEERTRIARELHDVVAHAISVILLQSRGARHARDQKELESSLDAIEQTAGSALGEMRRLLGILRRDDDELALAPQPSVDNLEVLAAQVREAGLPVDLVVEGEPRLLPPGVDLSAYRIVQEALTNALKHAGSASARVRIRYGAEALEVEIADDGPGAANGDAGGHGLIGMRERVLVFGGDLETGPRPEGGYTVRARLPL